MNSKTIRKKKREMWKYLFKIILLDNVFTLIFNKKRHFLSGSKSEKYSICLETGLTFYLQIVTWVIFHSRMDSIAIRKYKSEDYKDVCRIFVSAHQGNIKNGILIGRKSPYVISYLITLTMIGLFNSILWSIVGLIVGLSFHVFAVFILYNSFVL